MTAAPQPDASGRMTSGTGSAPRVLHITDPHVIAETGAEVYGTDPFRALESVLETAMALPQPPDVIVATGDLTDDASEVSYGRVRELLLATNLPTFVVPGNHDCIRVMKSALVGTRISMGPIVDLEHWRLVLLNSQHPGEDYGLLGDAELKLLCAATSEHPTRSVLTALHHTPVRDCPSSNCHLLNDLAFRSLLSTHKNARLVISGHLHIELDWQDRHTSFLTTPSVSSQVRHPSSNDAARTPHELDPTRRGFRMITLMDDGGFESEVHWLTCGVVT